MRHLLYKFRFIGLIALALVGGAWPMGAQAASSLGAESAFAVLASGTGLTCTDSSVAGPVGISPSSTAVTKTRCHMQVQVADGAYAAFLHDYSTMGGTFAGCNVLTGTLAGSLGPGTYCFDAAAALTGTLTLTGTGPWVIGIGTGAVGALTATSFTVVGSNPCDVFWWVQADVTLNTSAFQGTILGGGDITTTDTSLEGRLLATGAVTMTRTNIFGCNSAGTVTTGKQKHCNQGVGNGPEGCDPGNSNQGDESRSNDELGGTPGNPGRKGGNSNATVETKSITIVNSSAPAAVATKGNSQASSNHDSAAKGKSDLHANGKSKNK